MGHHKKQGFTLIELVIVVVIIAILATLSIVSYNGAQRRANNAKTLSAARSYLEAFRSLAASESGLPTVAANSIAVWNCLGEDYPSNRCWNNTAAYSENANLHTLLKKEIDPLPMPASVTTVYNGMMYAATGHLTQWTLDGQPTNWLIYTLHGNAQRCSLGPVATYPGSGFNFTSNPPSTGYTGTDAQSTTCWISLGL